VPAPAPKSSYLLFADSLLDRSSGAYRRVPGGTTALFTGYHERSSFGDAVFARSEALRKSAL
jgi:hypothetical protein